MFGRYQFDIYDLTEASIEQAGFCTTCGRKSYNVEPDARDYPCEHCNRQDVYGAEEIAMKSIMDVFAEEGHTDPTPKTERPIHPSLQSRGAVANAVAEVDGDTVAVDLKTPPEKIISYEDEEEAQEQKPAIPRVQLTADQQDAHDRVMQWAVEGDYYRNIFRFAGYAGTGKTTALANIVDSLEDEIGDVVVCAFTNKAASVLRSKGLSSAMTIHSALYRPLVLALKDLIESTELQIEECDPADLNRLVMLSKVLDDLKEKLKEAEEQKKPAEKVSFMVCPDGAAALADMIVIDESSMVNSRILDDMMNVNRRARILLVGDSAQLPPVQGHSPFLAAPPDVELDEIIRVDKDSSGLCDLANAIRTHSCTYIPSVPGCEEVLDIVSDISTIDPHSVDQWLCGKNVTRHLTNAIIRKRLYGFDSSENEAHILPQVGETLVGLANDREAQIYNGVIYKVEEILDEKKSILKVALTDTDGVPRKADINKLRFQLLAARGPNGIKGAAYPGDFDLGYCLTVHKSQGSEWDTVCLVDDSQWMTRRDPRMRCRWLYTAVTRAKKKLVYTQPSSTKSQVQAMLFC